MTSFALENEKPTPSTLAAPIKTITLPSGQKVPYNAARIQQLIQEACTGFEDRVSSELIFQDTSRNLFEGMPSSNVMLAAILSARSFIENEPAYTYVAARLLLQNLLEETTGDFVEKSTRKTAYGTYFPLYLNRGIEAGRLDARLKTDFDLTRISQALKPERDEQFGFLGLQTLYDRYFIHIDNKRIELPQLFWMRVSMGLALVEKTTAERTQRAIEFYEILSSFDFTSSTPTLFNSGTPYPQLSSCFLTTVPDDLGDIYKCMRDNAMLSKFSGGLGNDWTPVRGLGSHIKGTNGVSQGVIPFLKVANDTAIAVNQGGKRKGAVCSYLETWHMDIEEYLELRKNTGDDRRRTHDMNTANWIPDLFMKRVEARQEWTLFSPNDVPTLHDLYGQEFEKAYTAAEAKAARGEIKVFKKIPAVDLWRKMLTMLFETGHPWITFKDPSNLRSPQRHTGVVHSSNLCTEILLNTSKDETAVCNLGSVNLAAHVIPGKGLDLAKLEKTVSTAMRMLDNVIDQNLYPIPEAKNSNLKHRPVGLGIMGFQDALYKMRLAYDSTGAVDFADASMEAISYYAILASTQMAAERGTYESYKGSLWDQGILPIDSIALMDEARGEKVAMDRSSRLDWAPVREAVKKHGMRNSNCMAIAPTATISNIVGVSQSIEPTYKNLYVKSNMSGEFTVINPYLVEDLKALKLWDKDMVQMLKKYDGELEPIGRIPADLKALYKTAFAVEPKWTIEAASRRQKWIDMGQSLNLYIAQPNGKKLDEMYRFAWRTGLKTTYYLRSLAASAVEKSTITTRDHNSVAPVVPVKAEAAREEFQPKFCAITDPTCEACQ
ncbi:MAG: ribonucleoside-diphosphate reductase subunit alpha [Bdellovibrionales bacterium]|nr:ribonucleoside-diphosphate reductase subunit alpha [Bdellovibrionales bacterium]